MRVKDVLILCVATTLMVWAFFLMCKEIENNREYEGYKSVIEGGSLSEINDSISSCIARLESFPTQEVVVGSYTYVCCIKVERIKYKEKVIWQRSK